MLNIIQNTIGAIRRVGESVVRAGLKMWLPFTKAEPLGENLVVNGDFTTDSDWNLTNVTGGGASINTNDDTLVFTNGLGYVQSNDYILENGKRYIVKIDIESVSSGLIKVVAGADGSTYSPDYTAGGLYIHYFTPTTTHGKFEIYTGSSSTSAIINSVSVEEYAQETPDISGNDNNAILKTGKALQFTGNDSVQTSFPSSYTIKTIAFWINPTHSSTNEVVFYGGGAMAGTRELRLDHLQLEAINSNITMSTHVNGALEGVTYNGTPATLTQDEWQRVVLTSSTGFTVVSDTFDIGSGLYGSDGRFIMSDLQIYDEAWTTDDIAFDYANPQKLVTDNEDTSITLDNLKAWWHLSEGDGTIAFDSAPLIGKELVVNGDFSTDSDWTESAGSGWTISNGRASNDGSLSGNDYLINSAYTSIVGKTYKVVFTVSDYVQGRLRVRAGQSSSTYITANGTYTQYQVSTNTETVRFQAIDNFIGSIENVSVKEVYNIDGETYDGSSLGASYVDAQERIPQLGMMNWSKGSNLIEYSEDFSSSYWSKPDITLAGGYLAPDGTLSAYKVSADTITSVINRQFSGIGSYYRSIWAKTTSGTGTLSLLTRYDSTGSVVTITNEWQRFTINSSDSLPDYFYVADFRGGNLDEVILWGAQLEDADSVSAYRRTNGAAVTDATLIASATDSQKDILGNAVRVKGSGFNLDGTGYAEVLDDNVFDIPASSTQNGGAFSICGWAKWKYVVQPQYQSTLNTIYNNGLRATQNNTFSINASLESGNNIANAFISGTPLNGSTTYTQGEWFYFALTREVSTGSCKLYTSRIDSNGEWVVALDGTATNTDSLTNSDNKTIGWDGTTNDRRYHERIDDIKFYDRELSLTEIEQNFNATKSGHNN